MTTQRTDLDRWGSVPDSVPAVAQRTDVDRQGGSGGWVGIRQCARGQVTRWTYMDRWCSVTDSVPKDSDSVDRFGQVRVRT